MRHLCGGIGGAMRTHSGGNAIKDIKKSKEKEGGKKR